MVFEQGTISFCLCEVLRTDRATHTFSEFCISSVCMCVPVCVCVCVCVCVFVCVYVQRHIDCIFPTNANYNVGQIKPRDQMVPFF